VDFLSVMIEFFARYYGWGATNEYRLEIAVYEGSGSILPIRSGRRRPPHQPPPCRKTRCIALSSRIGRWFYQLYKPCQNWAQFHGRI